MVSRRSCLIAVPMGVTSAIMGARVLGERAAVAASAAKPDPAAVAAAAGAVRAFTADMYRELSLAGGSKRGNLVCSPYSAAVALAMARAGARGATATEMDTVLHAPTPRPDALNVGLGALDRALAAFDDPAGTGAKRPRLSMANALWPQYDLPLEQAFLDTLATRYGAAAHPVDFVGAAETARQKINAWVSGRTNDRIPQLLAQGVLTPETALVLTNAIYLKANWQFPFPKAMTALAPFTTGVGAAGAGTGTAGTTAAGTTAAGTTVQVPMMTVACGGGYLEGQGWQAVDLPYVGSELAMAVIVPTRPDLLASLEKGMDEAWLRQVLTGFTQREVQVRLPKWTFRLPIDLGDLLVKLGMPTAFTTRADFSGMSRAARLFISRVVHENFIAVDEYGTEAAAATGVIIGRTSIPASVVADRPFLYVIHDVATGTPLFIGRVVDPTVER